MSQETMFTIKTKLDASGFKDLEANAGKSLDTLSREFDEFNRKTKVAPNADDLKKSLEEAKKLLDALTAKKQIVIEKPKTKEVTKELAKLEEMLRQVARRHEILVGLDESAMKEAKEDIDDLKDSLEDLKDSGGEIDVEVNAEQVEEAAETADELKKNLDEASEKRGLDIDVSDLDAAAFKSKELADAMDGVANGATKLAAKSLGVSQSAAQGITTVIQRMTGLSAVLAGPLGLAVTAAVSGLAAYVLGLGKSSDASRKAESDLESISKYYLKLASDVEAATKATERQIELQLELLEATKRTASLRVESGLKKLEGLTLERQEQFIALTEKEIRLGVSREDSLNAISSRMNELTSSTIEASKNVETFGDDLKANGIQLEILGNDLTDLAQKPDWTAHQRAVIKILISQLEDLKLAFNNVKTAQDEVVDLGKKHKDVQNNLALQIENGFKKTTDGMLEARKKAVTDAKKLVQDSLNLEQSHRDKAASILKQAEKDLKDFQDSQIKKKKKEKETDEERIAALHARYAAQREISQATLADQQALKKELTGLEKAYYTELERLTREHYEKQVASGKALTDAQIAELNRIIEKNKELSKANNLAELEKVYNARVAIARSTITNEKQLEEELFTLQKAHAQERITLLTKVALDEINNVGAVTDVTKQKLRELMELLDKLNGEEKEKKNKKEPEELFRDIAGFMGNIVSNMGNFMSQAYDARIQSLDKALERELRLLENKHEQEMKMYEEQLEQYADLEEQKEELTKEHNERLEELNWKAQNHATEDEYAAIMEQRIQEEEKYAESMAALEADTLMRDEIRLQQELAEQEYMARKEQMEKDYAIRRAKLERKQAETQKAMALFQGLINVAQGITLAWAQGGAILGPIFAALVAAAGAIQIAAIASRPLPEIPSYHFGGTIGAANANNYGYLPPADNPHDKTLFWGQAGEEVLPLPEAEAYRRFKAMGFNLAGLIDRSMMAGVAPVPVALPVDNSKTVNQQVTYQVKNELTFSEARRLQAKANRAFIRSLA